ncbi:Prephenate dehydratase [Gemmata obscuriglobus]|uniref:Bifunctional chorismate mutase/prephenate dehydratase n=1 Tax=Gemmata obscuriglobus TaxID=114 RepID=A0A2Z3GW25_9BACT|nr:prephenate dehydratase [Gemmata obscuriglobus]AWM36282.1 prephenate dehydratase [Gemmata obscuriglobus]QEG31112.1 Prephenate dehydratase [Gemmata obscuriglobus]VTS10449.1 prephenate dehydratase : Prephenate dehydratase OS=Singulisphaera acidiphila (strain ATCC BAA-1392 / DSM 18658 / VKM B-2454 / MOB10) GN=Sinac_1486 PE=4 SV=1: CM_2: PDT: ACT [Gemmata obscuriglobus UQM 2246]
MARSKSEPSSNSAPDKGAANLAALRAQIDKFDTSILELLNKRAAVAAQIGKVKADQGEVVFSAAREEEVIANVLAAHKGPLAPVTVKAIFRELMSGSRAIQRQQKIAYLGPEYSYSHLAAIQRFGEASVYNRTANIAAVFEEVVRKHADFGVVPLENSTDGRVVDTLEMFMRFPDQVQICSEIRLRVRHHLLANCAQSEVRRVYSKEQALSQCRNWLAKNLPQASIHPVSSTADAARLVQTEDHVAAVASREAAVRYGIGVVAQNIADSPFNETRFAVIGATDSAKTGADKTALMFQINHTPGALADVLTVFKSNKINLTWIESFPFREAKGEYVFFVDFDGHRDEPKVKRTLASLEELCDTLTVLGSFPQARAEDE